MGIKDTFKRIVKYLHELSVVVAGIVITFGLSNWIGIRNEKKDVESYLEAVRLELEDNLPIMQNQFEFYDQTRKLARYLQSDKPENLEADSLAKYVDIMRSSFYINYKSSAFEMLKSSGAMRFIKDKTLLKSIIDCYTSMEEAQNVGNAHMNKQENVISNVLMEYGLPERGQFYDIREVKYRRLFHFFSNNSRIEKGFQSCTQQIEKTLVIF